jgi:hypothetical protein
VPWVENRKRSSAEASLTEVSPEKGVGGGQPGAQAPLLLQWKEKGGVEKVSEGSAKQKLDFSEDSDKCYLPRSGTPPPPPSAREQKRPKKQVLKKDKSVDTEAAFGSEGRQEP